MAEHPDTSVQQVEQNGALEEPPKETQEPVENGNSLNHFQNGDHPNSPANGEEPLADEQEPQANGEELQVDQEELRANGEELQAEEKPQTNGKHAPGNEYIEWLKQRIELDDYTPDMWKEDFDEMVSGFFEAESVAKLYFWVNEESGLQSSNSEPPLLSQESSGFAYFIKPANLGSLQVSDLEQNLIAGIIEKSGLDSLLDYMNNAFLPSVKSEVNWPDSVKKEFLGQLHSFMGNITEATHLQKGSTILYIPNEDIVEPEYAAKDKDLVQRLESTLIRWTRQIRDVVNNQDSHQENENAGPLDEIHHWKLRTMNLSRINDQLNKNELIKVLKVLRFADSSYLKRFDELASQIQKGAAEAEDNLNYLQTLADPCKQLGQVRPQEISQILPDLLQKVKEICDNSQYYNTNERITGLFRKISNEVINRCISIIEIDDLLGRDVNKCIADLKESKECGMTWKAIFEEHFENEEEGVKRNYNKGSIFSQVDAFVQRCVDLKQICKGQLQFARKGMETSLPYFGGTRGREITENIQEIEKSFNKQIDRIKTLDYNILDVKNTRWHGDYNKFKIKIKHLENMYKNIVDFAFQGVTNVTQGVEMLEAFDSLAKRKPIKQHIQKKAIDVYDKFKTDLELVKKEYDNRAEPPLATYHPRYGGAALWCRSLISRIQRQKSKLDQLVFISDESALRKKEEIYKKYEETFDRLKSYITGNLYKEWIQKIEEMSAEGLSKRMKRKVFHKVESEIPLEGRILTKNKQGTITCDYDQNLIKLVAEVKCWEKLQSFGVLIPSEVNEVAQFREEFRVIKENALMVVRDYNNIMNILNEDEKKLFDFHINYLNTKLKPGWSKPYDWNKKQLIEASIRDWKRQCGDCLEKVYRYKNNTERIDKQCEKITQIQLLNLNKKNVYEVEDFEERQKQHLLNKTPEVQGICDEILSIIMESYDIFNPTTEAKSNSALQSIEVVSAQWQIYLQKIDKQVEESLKQAVKQALNELNKAINGDTKNKPSPVFRLHIILDEQKGRTDYSPPRDALRRMISKQIENLIDINKFFVRISERFYDSQKELAEKIDKLSTNSSLTAAFLSSILQRPGDSGTEEPRTIFSFRSDKALKRNWKAIQKGVDQCGVNLESHLEQWMSDQYNEVWEKSKTLFLKRKKEMKPDYTSFEVEIKHYQRLISEVSNMKLTDDEGFVLVDSTRIKETIKRYAYDWIQTINNLVNEIAKEELYKLYSEFEKSEKELSQEPTDIEHLKRSKGRLVELEENVTVFENEIDPIEKKYGLLKDQNSPVTEDEETKLNQLYDRFEEWKVMLQNASVRLDKSFKVFKEETNKNWKEFEKSAQDVRNEFKQNVPFNVESGMTTTEAKKVIKEFRHKVANLKEKEESLQFGIELFEISAYTPGEITDMDRELDLLEEIWELTAKWDDQWEAWKNTKFYDLNVEVMTEVGNDFIDKLKELSSTIGEWGVWKSLNANLNIFLSTMPLVRQLSHRAIQERHWEELKMETKQQFNQNDPSFTLDAIWQLGLHQYADLISEIFSRAQAELGIYETIKEIENTWNNLVLNVIVHKENYLKLTATDELFQTLEENIVALSSMKSQIHSQPFQEEIAHWESTLSSINDTVEVLLQVQKQWLYLESIFVGKDQEEFSKKQLANERSDFMRANDRFMEEMKRIESNRNALKALAYPGFYDVLVELNTLLDKVKKGLDQFLSMERKKFPRFYFLSDDDLLNILGQGKNPREIQHHIKKLFEGIKLLEMTGPEEKSKSNKTNEIVSMIAPDNETVKVLNKVTAEGEVEIWLDQLEKTMQFTLTKKLLDCYNSPSARKEGASGKKDANSKKDKREWIRNNPGQLVITSAQIKWTLETEQNIHKISSETATKNPLKEQIKGQRRYIKRLVDYVRDPSNNQIERNKIVALITIEQHAREVLAKLIERNVSNINDFEWMQQLRFELKQNPDPDKDYKVCVVNQTSTAFEYGYEYQGNNGRLVVTPLTDRCYMTLTTALHMKRGGAPQGPAGTGKTETVKDLGKNMARLVIVINCSESMEFSSLGRLFSGFAQSGAWGCLDEFNRIEVEVLSVVAMQISRIQVAIKENRKTFVFEGDTISLNPNCGVFVTMNPGYAGRSELPDNLKSLFRPISMMTADLQLISEIMLLSEGFEEGALLSKKMVTLYTLMVQQLSKQNHYDFGMRALKSVLALAGTMKRSDPSKDEKLILMRALYNMNVPKLVTEDIDLFLALLNGIFSGVEMQENDSEVLKNEIVSELKGKGLQPTEMVVQKCLQLFDSKSTRHGNMVVGKALSGKTTVWKTLKQAMGNLHRKNVEGFQSVKTRILNPKSITTNELYGWYDSANEWHDGILSSIMKQMCEEEGKEFRWFVLDGPVDTKWIESMNSVLDDNKLLTLVNGDRISLPPNVRLLFEVEDLAQASPATVSRAGMVYLDVNEMGFEPYYDSWVDKKDPETKAYLKEWFEKYVYKVMECKKTKCSETVPTTDINSVISLTKVYDAFANPADLEKNDENYWLLLEKWFVFSLIWSVGASVDEQGRDAIDICVRDIESGFPHSGLIYDYYVNIEKKEWVAWSERLNPKPTIQPGTPYSRILIPTVDTYRNLEIMKGLVKAGRHVLSVGTTGTGKTALITTGLLATLPESFTYFTVNFSGQTSAAKTQDIIETSLEKRTSNKRGPPGNKQAVLFVDDLNMPKKEVFGAQPPLELLREWMDYGYWYDRQKQMPLYILELQMVAAMGPAGGGRAEISQRIQSHFNLLNFTLPDDSQMHRIYFTIINHHFSDFDEEVKPLAESFTGATINLYHKVREVFLPTPNKSHYVFNMRDVSRVFQGMYKASRQYHDSKESLVSLWAHECMRVFHDRMINYEDQEMFKQILDEYMQNGMGMSYKSCCTLVGEGEEAKYVDPLFVDSDLREDDNDVYDLVEKQGVLKETLEKKLEQYNSDRRHVKMNLVLFKDAIFYLCRIHRILKQESGHALLVGVGGSGRHSLIRLAAFVAGYEVVQLEINKNYKLGEFREDIKKMKWTAGVEGQPLVFIFSDNDVVNELFLEDVNNLLSAGEVPNIYTNDELKDIREAMKKPAKKLKRPETPDGLYTLFIERVRHNMHICFCISPVGAQFRDYCRVYPSLINNTTINWFMPWPEEALFEVAKKYTFEQLDFKDQMKLSISDVFCKMHVSVLNSSNKMYNELKRQNYITPTHYLDLVSGYVNLLGKKQNEIGSMASKLRNGLSKLEDAKQDVESMSKELEVKKNEVSKMQEQCEDLMTQINSEQTKADKSQKEMESKKTDIEKEKISVESLKAEAQADLDKALPALLEAEEALNKLDKKEISEVKSYSQPPEAVRTVMEAVMIILSSEKPSWANSKKLLSEPDFLRRIKEYDKENIPNKILKKLEHYTQKPEFQPAKLADISAAASALCAWVHAIESYAKTFRDVEPKRQTVNALESNLFKMEEKLTELANNLQEVTDTIQNLDLQLREQEEQRTSYEERAKELQVKLERAEKLVSGLGSERIRWEGQLVKFDEMYTKLPGDCLVSAAFIAYCGPFTSNYRDELVDQVWIPLVKKMEIPMTPEFSFSSFMATPTEIREWNLQKLPTDKFSVENGILATKSNRWPLMIDPQRQANEWIKNMEKDQLKSVNPQKRYMPIMENAITTGFPVLLEDIEEDIDPSLDPILKKAYQMKGKVLAIKLGDKEIRYNEKFKLYLTTRMSNPHYTPEISTKVIIVNFQVKEAGLEEQLLGLLVRKEDPKREEEKDELVVSIARNNKTLVELEDKILGLLDDSSGSLLEDEKLIQTLQTAKETGEQVKQELETSEFNIRKIDAMREDYRPCATKASVLYFVLASLSYVDPMYQFSLESYLELFSESILKSKEKFPVWDGIRERIGQLDKYHMYSVYTSTCRALFEKHKLLLSLQICVELSKLEGNINLEEYNFFLRGGSGIAQAEQTPNPDTDWITQEMWDSITELESKISTFQGIEGSMIVSRKEWKRWFQTSEPENEHLPGEWDAKADDMRKMVLLRCLRPDRLIFAVTDFVAQRLGAEYVEPPQFNLKEMYHENSKSTQPLLFVLSPGVDPAPSLKALAEENHKDIEIIPLGKGQDIKAEKALTEAAEKGFWVFLANCHLAISWMPRLEELIESLIRSNPDKDFRLWLSSDPHPRFPISILQRCAKMTTEPPKGIRANMLRLYSQLTQRHFSRVPEVAKYKKLLFSLCWFHSILVERKKFKSLGWNTIYSFNDSDWEVSENILAKYFGFKEEDDKMDVDLKNVPWDAIRYLIAEISYGGRVTDDRDRRLLMVYATDCFNPAVIDKTVKYKLVEDSQTYFIPDDSNYKPPPEVTNPGEFYVKFVKAFPSVDKPELFGQHVNAQIASQISDTKELLDSIMALSPKAVEAGNESVEDKVLSICSELLEKIPEPFNEAEIKQKWHYDNSSIKVVLVQEISRYNKLLSYVRNCINQLEKGIKGLVVISEELELQMDSLFQNKVPEAWKFAYPSLKPLASWVRDLQSRIAQLRTWSNSTAPTIFWISGLTYPTGFTTALLQTAASVKQCAIDSLNLDTQVVQSEESEISMPPKEGAYIKGLYLEGGKWDPEEGCLCEPEPMELTCSMPVIHLKPVKDKKKAKLNIYSCPCYYYSIRAGTRERPSFMFYVDLKSGEYGPDFWVRRGTALLMNLDN